MMLASRVCSRSSMRIASRSMSSNVALVFVKPHANTPAVQEFVPKHLEKAGGKVIKTGSIDGASIDSQGIIDSHYSVIAKVGMERDMNKLGFNQDMKDAFKAAYGKDIDGVIASGKMYSAITAVENLPFTATSLLAKCLSTSPVKLGAGLYCTALESGDYVVNGFYAAMREKFVAPSVVVHWYVTKFAPDTLSWKSFRGKTIGATNPADAADGSLRAAIRDNWEKLGLKNAPNFQDNGVHASAGPLEGLRERTVWLGEDPLKDAFGAALAEAHGADKLKALLENPDCSAAGQTGSAFDLLEDVDSDKALEMFKDVKIL